MREPGTDAAGATSGTFRERAEAVSPAVWRCLRRFGVPASDVEDCFQAVLLQLHRRWEQLGALPVNELRNYACCVAIGVARGAARSRRRHEVASGDLANELVALGTPESQVQHREQLAQLDAILLTMVEERREVFVLYELEGLTGPEIAKHLGLPLGTVASRLKRARVDFEDGVARSRRSDR